MSERDPIVLPSLAAQRGPTAAVCVSGHVFSWFLDPSEEFGFCAKCGEPILVLCPACNAPLPGDGEMLRWVPYHSYCNACGKPYPWIAAEISRAKRMFAEQAQAQTWSDEVKARADELVDEIVTDRAGATSIASGIQWLVAHGAESAEPALLEVVERLGSVTLKQALRPHFPGSF